MCGIGGVFAYSEHSNGVDLVELAKISDRLSKRGPDSYGEWTSSDFRVGLVHRRLAIIDLSDAGSQPMASSDGRYVVVFNGEIYNHKELRAGLAEKGYSFASDCDTEVILNMYAEYGNAMLPKLRGMYAFCIYDEQRKCLLLGRDPFGIKPLYYSKRNGEFRFASQVKALMAGGRVSDAPNPAGHVGFYVWGAVPEPHTLYRDVQSLPPGSTLRIDINGSEVLTKIEDVRSVLCSASMNPHVMPYNEAAHYVADAIKQSVEKHMIADVEVGMFLSAGLDSAMVAGSASQHGVLRSVTLGFSEYIDTEDDESSQAAALAEKLGAKHSTKWINERNFQDDLVELLDAMDQPSIDGVNTWFVAKAAKEAGLKVALSGLGGDELLASYPSFKEIPRLVSSLRWIPKSLFDGGGFRKAISPVIERFASPKYAGLLQYGRTFGGAYLLRRSLYMPWEVEEFYDDEFLRDGLRALNLPSTIDEQISDISNARMSISAMEMTHYMRNQLLRDADWAGMANSIEIRVPLVDMHLLKTVAAVIAGCPQLRKADVARCFSDKIPQDFFDRKKTGFSTPVKNWIERNQSQAVRGLRGWAREVYAA